MARLDADDEVGDGDSSESAGESASDDVDESGSNSADEQADTIADDAEGDSTTDGDAGTTQDDTATGDGDTATGDGDTATTDDTATGDTATGDGDMSTGDGDMSTGDGDTATGDGDMSTGDGDMSTGDGDMSTGDGDTSTDGNPLVDDQCDEPYLILSLADRNNQYNDGDGNVEWCDRLVGGGNDDQWEGSNWYRFMGEAGTRMPVFPPLNHSCGTEAAGWLLGGHPGVAQGVTPKTACFAWGNDTCQWDEEIEVVDCDGFYLYHLFNTTSCSLRYCGTN